MVGVGVRAPVAPCLKVVGLSGGECVAGVPAGRAKSAALGQARRCERGAKASTRSSTRAMQAKGPKISKASGGRPSAYQRGVPEGGARRIRGPFPWALLRFVLGFPYSKTDEEKLI